MNLFFPWLLMLLVFAAAYPWAAWLLRRDPLHPPDRPLILCLTLALSSGALTLIMFWEGLLLGRLDVTLITLGYVAAMLPGMVLWRRDRASLVINRQRLTLRSRSWDHDPPGGLRPVPGRVKASGWKHKPPEGDPKKIALTTRLVQIALVGVVTASLFNAAYWPFSRPDALGIYHRTAELMEDTHQLAPLLASDSPYYTYPAFMPLLYTYTYLASGWENQYVARTAATVLSLACLAAAYSLGRALGGRRVAWLAAILLAVTPTFGVWASSGYVDLPAGFFFTLAALFAYRLWQSPHWSNALLAGLTMGLAAWTKNVALIGVVALAVWLLWCQLHGRILTGRVGLSLLACALVAGAWYLRNLLVAGLIVPATAWTDTAQRTLGNLLVFLQPDLYGVTGLLIIAGIGFALVRFVRQPHQKPGDAILLLWTLPVFGAWWLLASYDPRFLLLILPVLTVAAARAVDALWPRLPIALQARAAIPAALAALVLASYMMWISVEYKEAIARNPLMDNRTKRDLVGQER